LTNTYQWTGQRQQREEAATIQQLLWDGGRLLAARSTPAAQERFYTRGARLAKARLAAADRFFHEDAQTSVQALTDEAETLETRYALSAWGEVLAGGVSDNPFRYLEGFEYWYEEAATNYQGRWAAAHAPGIGRVLAQPSGPGGAGHEFDGRAGQTSSQQI